MAIILFCEQESVLKEQEKGKRHILFDSFRFHSEERRKKAKENKSEILLEHFAVSRCNNKTKRSNYKDNE